MVGKTNVTGARLRAVIAVTYPEGSICTCSNGTKTMKARDTSGKALFNVAVGEWTVSCTYGSQTASKPASITEDGQSKSVKLTYKMWWFSEGVLNGGLKVHQVEVTPNIVNGDLKLEAAQNQYGALVAMFTNPVPASVNSIKLKVKYTQSALSYYNNFFVSTKDTWPAANDNKAAFVVMNPSSKYVEYTLDLSNITQSVYIWFGITTDNAPVELLISELVEV